MIISASRRTDIPAFYSEWFFNRLKAGEVWVRNPFDKRKISTVSLRREYVDFIHFWTKNPAPLLKRLGELEGYRYAFHFTVNGYGKVLEPHVPALGRLFDTFGELSRRCGPEKVSWRYSPILIGKGWGVGEHLRNFENIASRLGGLTLRCYISLLDEYPKIRAVMAREGIFSPTFEEQEAILGGIASIARSHGIRTYSCAEHSWHEKYGIIPGRCLDPLVPGRNCSLYRKDPNQRAECLCVQSVDIGGYSSCPHDCVYCYANRTTGIPAGEFFRHDPLSPLITGRPRPTDIITEHSLSRKAVKSREPLAGSLFGPADMN